MAKVKRDPYGRSKKPNKYTPGKRAAAVRVREAKRARFAAMGG